MKKYPITCIAFVLSLFPFAALAEINTFYDLKLKIEQIQENIANSPIYGIIFSSLSIIGIFIGAIILAIVLIMFLKRD